MVPSTNRLAFALAALVLDRCPGPQRAVRDRTDPGPEGKGGLLSVLGNAMGELLQIATVVLRAGLVLAQSVLLFNVVKFAGAAYLIYLGIQDIRHRGGGPTAADPIRSASALRILRKGFIVGAANPKSNVFFVAVLPQFVDYPAGAIPLQLGTLGAVFLLIALVSDSARALAAGTDRHWFDRSPGGSRP
jgi:threonine/homoserine/homoserine lactone efflux protein